MHRFVAARALALALLLPLLFMLGATAQARPAACQPFAGFPLSFNLGSGLNVGDGETVDCLMQKTQAAVNAFTASPNYPVSTITGGQTISVASTGDPPGGSVSSLWVQAQKSAKPLFEIGARFDCSTNWGSSEQGTPTHYLGEMVCAGSTIVANAGAGGAYAFTGVVQENLGVNSIPIVGMELDINKLGSNCGDAEGYVAGGLYVLPCEGLFVSGGGNGKRLRSAITIDLGGADSTKDSTTGLALNRGLTFMNGTIRQGVIEDWTTSDMSLKIRGRKFSAGIDLHSAAVDTGIALWLAPGMNISWQNNAGTASLALLSTDTTDHLVLRSARFQTGANQNLYVQPASFLSDGVTLTAATDGNATSAGLALTGSAVAVVTGQAGFLLNLDGTLRRVLIGSPNSCSLGRCLYTAN